LLSVSAKWLKPSAAARAARSATAGVAPSRVKWEWTSRWVKGIIVGIIPSVKAMTNSSPTSNPFV